MYMDEESSRLDQVYSSLGNYDRVRVLFSV